MENIYTQALMNATLALCFMVLFLLFFYLQVKTRIRLDKYRIKYGFDRELERTELHTKDKEGQDKILNSIEKEFRRRTYQDIGEKKNDSH